MVPGPLTGASLLDFIPSLKAVFLFDDDFRRIAQALSFQRNLKSSGRYLKKCLGSGQSEAERAKRANKSRREWGIGSGEWVLRIDFLVPTPHSPFPPPSCFLLPASLTIAFID